MSRIGVFICHCGENISATVDCEKVAEAAAKIEGVAYAISLYPHQSGNHHRWLLFHEQKNLA